MRKCAVCDSTIPIGVKECPNCGWTYAKDKSVELNKSKSFETTHDQISSTNGEKRPEQYKQRNKYGLTLLIIFSVCLVVLIVSFGINRLSINNTTLDENTVSNNEEEVTTTTNNYSVNQEDVDLLYTYFNKSLELLDEMGLQHDEYFYGVENMEDEEIGSISIITDNVEVYYDIIFNASETFGPYITLSSYFMHLEVEEYLSENDFSVEWMNQFLSLLDENYNLDLGQIALDEINLNFSFENEQQYTDSWYEGTDWVYIYFRKYTEQSYLYISFDYDLVR